MPIDELPDLNDDLLDLDDVLPDLDDPRGAAATAPSAAPAVGAPVQPGPLEQQAEQEVTDLLAGFRARARQEQQRFDLATDSEYWVALCFQSREQVEAFLAQTGWDAPTAKYVDGQAVAKRLGIRLPKVRVPFNLGKRDKRLSTLADGEDRL